MRVTEDHLTALKKLCGNSGLRFRETLKLEKDDFNFKKKTILINSPLTKQTRYATILPSDIKWFKTWFKTFNGRLFPLTDLTLLRHLRINNIKPAQLRQDLARRMLLLNYDEYVIYMKLGRVISNPRIDTKKVFKKLIKLESQPHENVEVKN